ncbi:hypothetical protein [Streptomyces rimosus]|uniref:hypothetical protein n=1 Tax=Streptomyces rimosus TaxID=1927 RepID=UPI0004C841C0|nr:hypothetical protein [Streptomyces rimosus]
MPDTRPRTLTGTVSAVQRPYLVRGDDTVPELRFRLSVKRWTPEGRYGGTDVHHVVLRDEHTNLAVSYVHALAVGTRLHLHGTWRQRLDADAWIDEFTVTRLWTPLPIPSGTRLGRLPAQRTEGDDR